MKIDVGDGVVMRDEAFKHFDEDCSELRGIVGEVIHITANEDLSAKSYTLKVECPTKVIITKMPVGYLQIPGRA